MANHLELQAPYTSFCVSVHVWEAGIQPPPRSPGPPRQFFAPMMHPTPESQPVRKRKAGIRVVDKTYGHRNRLAMVHGHGLPLRVSLQAFFGPGHQGMTALGARLTPKDWLVSPLTDGTDWHNLELAKPSSFPVDKQVIHCTIV